MEALNTAQHQAAEAMYKNASAAGGGGGRPAASPAAARPAGLAARGAATGDVIDAEVVEEEKK